MSALMENSLTSMKAAFPTAPEPIHRMSTLTSLIDLVMHMCHCSQTQKTPASGTMNILFLAASPDLHLYFTNKVYPSSYFPFPKEVDDILDFSACTSNNERERLKTTLAHDQKLKRTQSWWILPSPMFSSQIYQKRFVKHTSWSAWNNQTLFFSTCSTGSSQSTGKRQPMIARQIGR